MKHPEQSSIFLGKREYRRVEMRRRLLLICIFIFSLLICSCGKDSDDSVADSGATGTDAGEENYVYVSENVTEEFGDISNWFIQGIKPDGTVYGTDSDGKIVGIGLDADFGNIDLKNSTDVWISDDVIARAAGEEIGCFGLDGSQKGSTKIAGSRISNIVNGGYILYHTIYDGREDTYVCHFDPDKCRIGDTVNGISGDINGLLENGCDENIVYYYDSKGLYSFSIKNGELKEIFLWLDVNLENAVTVWKDGEDFYACCFSRYTGKSSIYKVTKKKKDEIEESKKIVIATLGGGDFNLPQLILDYNKSQDEYFIELRDCADHNDMEGSRLRLQAELLAGTDIDMFYCGINESTLVGELVRQGYFVNQWDYLEEEEELSGDDFYPEVLKAGIYGDTLYQIPRTFELESLILPSEEFSPEEGWTMKAFLDYLERYPEGTAFCRASASDYWYWNYFFFRNTIDCFVNEENHECYFESEEFKRLLYAIKRISQIDNSDVVADYSDIRDEDERLAYHRERFVNHEWLIDHNEIRLLEDRSYSELSKKYGDDYVDAGFPTKDGKGKTILSGRGGLAILSSSENKSASWDFIKYALTREPEWSDFDLYSYKKSMEYRISRELELFGQTEEVVKDEDGNVIQVRMTNHCVDQAGVDALFEALSRSEINSLISSDIYAMICQETDPYFKGEKELDDVCRILQSRASILLSERSR